ncbi:tRNA (adenosine(37)-N6)-dimethylallyltransferase MiaA [Aeromicrobium alkaliterrae]|uniref:tRNA dimethylallyltransferase n=1 Tax=Aeromicrobium alkaliterrae TaxID=302168 RepID=A0ABP4VP27_9ACTN
MAPIDHVVGVVGPTGVGKSDLAIELALRLGGEIVSTDAYQLYRDLDIGTAKVLPHERRDVPHHLIDVLDLGESASVAQFQRAAREVVDDCRARGVVPIVVGGSSLYVRAVFDDLDFPGTDPQVRARWTARLDEVGAARLHRELAAVDPAAAAQILASNGRRIVRALEVVELTGQPFRASMPPHESVIGPATFVGLTADLTLLDARLAARVEAMWAAGLVEEVRGLAARGLGDAPTASRAIGYAEALAYLAGEIGEDEARARTVLGTQRFARKQLRLFGQDPRVTWLPHDAPDLVEQALEVVVPRG